MTRSNLKLSAGLLAAVLVALLVYLPGTQAQEANKITVPLDGVKVIQTASSISRVVTGQSDVVKIKVINSREVAIFGVNTGATTLHIWTERGLRQNLLAVEEVASLSLDNDFRAAFTQQEGVEGRPEDMEMRVFSPEYREVTEFEGYIQELLQEDGRVILSDQPSGKIFVVGRSNILNKIQDLIDRLDVPGEEKIYSKRIILENRSATQIAGQIETMLSDQGKYITDRETNSILVVDKVSKVNEVENYLQKIDVSNVKQVRIKSRFVEMSEEAEKELGIKWQSLGSNGRDVVSSKSGEGPLAIGSGFGGFQAVYESVGAGVGIDAQLRALESENMLNLISAPSVVTRNQQDASLSIQNTESYLGDCNVTTVNTPSGTTTEADPVIAEAQEEILLNVMQPHIGRDDVVRLKVEPTLKIVSFTGDPISSDCGDIRTPSIDNRRATLNVALQDGQTLVIGGLSRQQKDEGSTGVPLLSKIPILGSLFSSQTKQYNEDEITIFLTAEIIDISSKKSVSAPDGVSSDLKDTGNDSPAVETKSKDVRTEQNIF